MCQVNPKTDGSSTRSTRRVTASPPVHLSWPDPPGRRSIVASWPTHVPRPSAVVSAAHTLAGGCASSRVRSMRSGKPMTASIVLQPFGCYIMATNRLRQLLLTVAEPRVRPRQRGDTFPASLERLCRNESLVPRSRSTLGSGPDGRKMPPMGLWSDDENSTEALAETAREHGSGQGGGADPDPGRGTPGHGRRYLARTGRDGPRPPGGDRGTVLHERDLHADHHHIRTSWVHRSAGRYLAGGHAVRRGRRHERCCRPWWRRGGGDRQPGRYRGRVTERGGWWRRHRRDGDRPRWHRWRRGLSH